MGKDESQAEEYYRNKNSARKKRKIGRAVGTTACCGIPCVFTSALIGSAAVFIAVRGLKNSVKSSRR